MTQIIKRVTRDCNGCIGASYDPKFCETCEHERVVETEYITCHDCKYKAKNVLERKNVLMCRKLHAWVKPTDFCAWGERIEE